MNTDVLIRMAEESDAEEILKIYSPYITDTAITFEYDIPSLEEFKGRIKKTLKMYPYIVALDDNCIVGYAYASAFKERAAYNWSVETTIYMKQECKGKGLGKKLYLALEDILRRQNIINLNACIAYTFTDDVHLSNSSSAFHEHFGFKKVAHFSKCGYKFGTWYDMIWMEKMIGEHPETPDQVIPISDIQL